MTFFKRKYLQLWAKVLKYWPGCELQYLKVQFYLKNNTHLNLSNPKEFAEKIQWLKLYLYKEDYQKYVDKYEVRAFIAESIGSRYLNELIHVYDSVNAIDISELPEKFVLKGTHGSGYNVIVKDKSNLNWSRTKKKLQKFLSSNYYTKYFEFIYKDIQPRIIAEKFLDQLDNGDIIDYKFMCFHGEPHYIHVKTFQDDRIKECYYNMNWEKQLPNSVRDNHLTIDLPKPSNFDEMAHISRQLSKGFIFLRVDLYNIENQVYFGELTFFHKGGMKRNYVEYLNKRMGDLIKLPIAADV